MYLVVDIFPALFHYLFSQCDSNIPVLLKVLQSVALIVHSEVLDFKQLPVLLACLLCSTGQMLL